MRIVAVGVDGANRECQVAIDPSGRATVADLVAALAGAGTRADVGLEVDGRYLGPDTPLDRAGVVEGSTVRLVEAARAQHWPAAAHLVVVAGEGAGTRVALTAGDHVVGRDPSQCDVVVDAVSVSGRHCGLHVTSAGRLLLADLGSSNGTSVAGAGLVPGEWRAVEAGEVIRFGGLAARIELPVDDRPAGADRVPHGLAGARPFNRPPRPAPPAGPAPIRPPDAARGNDADPTFSWVAFLAPMAFGGVTAILFNPLFALFALLSPVIVGGSFLEAKRRTKRRRAAAGRSHAAAVLELGEAARAASAVELERRRAVLVDVAEVVRRATAPSSRLWERRPAHGDGGYVTVGLGDERWLPPVEGRGIGDDAAAAAALADAAVLVESPVAAAFVPGHAVGVHGDPDASRAVARSLLLQAAVHTGPADLRIAVLCSPARAADWAWTRWLPHTRELSGAEGLGGRLVAEGTAEVEAVVRVLGSGEAAPAATIVVVDGDDLLDGRLSPARRLLAADAATGIAVLAVAEQGVALPAACLSTVGVVADGRANVHRPADGTTTDVLAALLPVGVAEATARAMAGFDDPEQEIAGAGLPERTTLTDVLGFDPSSVDDVLAAWVAGGDAAATPIGVGPDGTAAIDLDRQGPHALIAGTTGSGKSELLRTLVGGLAATGSPEHVSFLLVDFKGGGAFDALAGLPHVVGVVTDLDDGLAEVALRSLDGELRRRERLLRDAGADSRATYLAGDPAEPLPRLVIVVDEFATLAAQHPGFLDGLVAVAQRGRSLGIHLVLATQRPSGSVSRDIQANVALRISLRVADERDSVEVLGVPAAARIGRGQVGRALVRSDAFDLVPVQVASSGEAPARSGRPPVVVGTAGASPSAETRAGALAELVAACAEAAARSGARSPEPLWGPEAQRAGSGAVGLDDLLGLGALHGLDAAAAWGRRGDDGDADLLRVPIGIDDATGDPVRLDLKEVAQGGTGPHGLVVGTTGSGKSELLRTLVTALAATHHPDDLALVLVDFKGGATFAGLGGLPHVAGAITNLAGDEALLDRFHLALGGEQRRRQEVLAAGGAAGIVEHRAARRAGADLPPLPHLVVVIDEFAELLAARPDFLDLFVAIGRLGRSLGVHLLFASQQLDEGRLRGLEGNLGYRIALRTATANDSRAVLGTTAAATLPPEPGLGYLKDVGGEAVRFKAALVSAPAGDPASPDRSTMAAVVDAAAASAPKVHQVWLPPLEPIHSLDELLGPASRDPERGWTAAAWPDRGRLRVPIGIVDRPAEQRRATHVVDLAATPSLAIVGGPQSGKTTAVRTLLTALFATHTPLEVAASLLDFGGGLAPFAGDPHVTTVADRTDPALAARALKDAIGLLDQREARLRRLGVDSMADYRARRRDGLHLDDPIGDLLVVIDGWSGLKAMLDDADNLVAGLAARGASLGVHVVVTANRWADLRTNLRDALGGKLELRLADPGDSAVDRKAARTVPAGRPGRGLLDGALHVQVALPRLDGRREPDGLGAVLAAASAAHADAWPGAPAPAVRLLPATIPAGEVRAAAGVDGHRFALGVGEDDLAPVVLDLAAGPDPHLLVLGDGGSGRSSLLDRFVTEVGEQAGPGGASFCIVDPRRSLLERAELPWVDGYAAGAQQAAAEAQRIRALLAEREPGPDVTPAQLRDRSWWDGPEVYVVVDDYDLLVTPAGNPLAPLLDVLAAGRDVGFHLVVARRVAGASRGLFEPVLQRVRELGGPVLLLAGDPGEGPIVAGLRPAPLPPGRGHLVERGARPSLVQVAR